ncbi:hypothetical protein AM609_10540 [Actinomyces sp. oral taxon 414]|nr:hypothetical protein AM609_09115 [Actinomyces sp. oral taxon 414]ALC99798.1 hypothetical protein AM609_10540 [Actinomyces sp. oral taxon 414]
MVVASQIAVVRCPARARRTRNAMPPMWTVPLRVMVSSRSPLGAMGLRRCGGRRPAGASRAGSPPGVMGSVSWPGRGARATSVASQACCPVMRPGRPGWGRWVLQGVVEAVDPSPGGSAMESASGCWSR